MDILVLVKKTPIFLTSTLKRQAINFLFHGEKVPKGRNSEKFAAKFLSGSSQQRLL